MATHPNYPTTGNGRISGEDVVYGAPKISIGSTGTFICQSCSKTQGGEIKEYNDEAGDTVVLVRKGDHREFSIDGLIDKDFPDQKQGATISIVFPTGFAGATGSMTYIARIQTWQRSYSNEDVAKVSITARTYPAIDGGTTCDPECDWSSGSTASV